MRTALLSEFRMVIRIAPRIVQATETYVERFKERDLIFRVNGLSELGKRAPASLLQDFQPPRSTAHLRTLEGEYRLRLKSFNTQIRKQIPNCSDGSRVRYFPSDQLFPSFCGRLVRSYRASKCPLEEVDGDARDYLLRSYSCMISGRSHPPMPTPPCGLSDREVAVAIHYASQVREHFLSCHAPRNGGCMIKDYGGGGVRYGG